MENKTQTYFKTLFFSVIIFTLAKFISHNLNKSQAEVKPLIVIETQEEIVIKKVEPIVTENKPIVIQNGLQTGNNWRSR